MRKIVYVILGLSVLWLAKLNYDVVQYSQTVPQLQQQLDQVSQRYALLNDQFVAVQRQLQNNSAALVGQNVVVPMLQTGISPAELIRQQLQLVQFAIDQQQFIYALEHLDQLYQHISQYELAPALQQSLMAAIIQDKQAIQQFVLAQTQQQQQVDQLLQQIDQQLQQQIQQPDMTLAKKAETSWQWFKLEKVQRTAPDLMKRNVSMKEAQLRLLLASQALHQGQIAEYRQSVQEVIQLLQALPDQASQQIQLRLEKVLNLNAIPMPKLSALALLG